MRIGFQTHFLFFRVIASGLDLLRQKLQQSLRPLQTGSRGLQQFTQVQQIGQAALAIAEAKVPGAQRRGSRIESEHGRRIYAFFFSTEGRRGVEEVRVDALTAEARVLHQGPLPGARGVASTR
jgi:hypothetical protein